jgi:hypothetical protein
MNTEIPAVTPPSRALAATLSFGSVAAFLSSLPQAHSLAVAASAAQHAPQPFGVNAARRTGQHLDPAMRCQADPARFRVAGWNTQRHPRDQRERLVRSKPWQGQPFALLTGSATPQQEVLASECLSTGAGGVATPSAGRVS